jgi:hypothetical protein
MSLVSYELDPPVDGEVQRRDGLDEHADGDHVGHLELACAGRNQGLGVLAW